MAPVLEADDGHVDARFLQGFVQALGLVRRDDLILVAVDDQERGIVGRDVRHGAGGAGFGLLVGERAAEEPANVRVRLRLTVARIEPREISRPEEITDGLHADRLIACGCRRRPIPFDRWPCP